MSSKGKAAAVKAVAIPPPPLPPAHDEEHQQECIVCAEPLNQDTHLHTVSVCGHPETICSMCFFRIRSLQHNFSCPTCKRQLDHVICVTDKIVKYDDFNIWGDNIDGYHFDEPSKMFFPTEYFQQNIAKLRQYSCRLCHQTRRDFKQLKGHYFGEHQRHLCQLCHDHKQIFPAELVCYDQAAYERHIRHGDGDGSVGHPNCEFCRTRFYDSHALFIHLSREHYTCHICEQLGQKFKYFHSYQHLETHFRKDHIICEDPACLERRFVVFSNEFDFAAHNRQYHPHLASGRGVQIRFNYKGGAPGNSTASSTTTEERTTTQDNPEYVSRNARFEGGLGGRAQNGEWQVEIQAMSRDPRDPNRHTRTDTLPTAVAAATNAPQEEFPTLASTMGTATLGPQKWAQARSDGVNQLQKRANDFPALPSSTSAKGSSFNKNSLVKGSIPLSRSTGSLASSAGGSSKKASAAAAVVGTGGSTSSKNQRSAASATVVDEDDWNTTGYTNNYSYEYDLSAAIAASLADAPTSRPLASTSRTASATQLNRASPQTLEEAFPALGGGGGSGNATPSVPTTATTTTGKTDATKKKPTANKSGKLSNDLMDAMKMIGSDPSKKKKKASSGLTVVKTLKPRTTDDDNNDSGNTSPVPAPPAPVPITSRLNPPPAPGMGGIGKGPSWGKTYGGFGGSAPSAGGASQADFPSLR